ncbi:MAG TPA: hypothetical protein VFW40_08745, partial [Capsulimonadaceae bacterium]|nr:hypothetical protein [Capsulimonadaceae bacterium]
NSLFDEPSTVSQDLGPWGHPADGGGGLENVARAGSSTEEAIETGSRWASMSKAFGVINKFMNPIGMVSNAVSLRHDIQQGNWADAAADAAGFTGSGIGTAGSLGLIGEASSLGPVGAAAGSFAGGYAAGSLAVGEANDYAKNNNIFGQDRDSSEAAGDAGTWVQNKLHSDYLPDFVGDAMGAEVAINAAPVTALYSGGHAAVSGIESGAEYGYDWVRDHTGGGPKEDNNIDIGSTMDQIDAKENESELYGNM